MKKVLAFVLSAAMMLPALPMKAFSQNALPETAGEEVTKPETVNAEAEVSETTVENNMAADTAAVAKEDSVNEEETEVMAHAIPASGDQVSDAEITRIVLKKEVEATGGPLNVMIMGKNLMSGVEIKAFVGEQEAGVEFKSTLEGDERRSFSTIIPENTTVSPVVYRIEVYPTGKSEEKKTGLVTVKAVTIVDYNSSVKSVAPVKNEYSYARVNVSFGITGRDLNEGGLEYKITKNGQPYKPALKPIFKNIVGKFGEALDVTFEIEPNEGEQNVTYTFSVKGKKEADFKSASITQRSLNSYVLIKNLSGKAFNIPVEGEKIRLEMELNKEWDGELKTEVRKDGVKVDCLVEKISTDKKNSRIIDIHFPANTVKEDVNYTVHFMTDTENFLEDPIVTVIQAALSDKTVFSKITTGNGFLPLAGGQSSVNIFGANLIKENMEIKAFKLVGSNYVEATNDDIKLAGFDGREEIMTCLIDFMPVKEETVYRFVVSDKKDNNQKEILITLSEEGSNKQVFNLNPENLYYINDTTIRLAYNEPVMESRKDAILKNVKISKTRDGETRELPSGTTISIDEAGISIDVKEWMFKMPGSEENDYRDVWIHFPQRTIETTGSNAYQNKAFSFVIRELGIVETSEFVEGEVLGHEGGRVHLRVTGHNFVKEKIRARVAKQEPLRKLAGGKIGVTELKGVEVKATETQIDVTFTAPENETKHIENYIVLLSFDGINYSSEYAQTMNERAKRMVIAVKNKGLDTKEPVLGFAKITSYETNPLNEDGVPDSLHTVTPINQESKKTFVYLYGMNLDQNKTKIRAVDQNGVLFSPVVDSSADSGDRFMLVGWAILGYNNNQFIEIIAPRGYKKDQTYTYQIAVDGKNFNEEIVVRATVKYDGETHLDKDALLCEMKLNFVDEKGRVIHEPLTLKGYKQLPVSTVSMLPIEIEGYKYTYNHNEYDLYHKRLDAYSPQIKEGKMGEITYIYKNLNPEKEEPQKDVGENKGGNDYTEYNPEVVKENEGRSEDKTEINVEDPELPLGEVDAEAFDIPEVAPLPNVLIEDVKDSKYEKEITELAKYGIIKGTGENKVEPKKELSRAMFVEMLFRTVKDKTGDNKVLTDISSKDWFYQSASWASAQGIVKGDAKGNFNGKKPLTAAEFAVMMDRFMKKFNIVLPKTAEPQKAEGPKWAIEALNNMYEMAVFGADIKATDLINREQAAGVLYKLLKAKNVIK